MKTVAQTLAVLSLGMSLVAEEPLIVGPRSLGMGGTGVATSHDYTAAYYNPATFGFFGEKDDQEGLRADNNDLGRRGYFGLGVVDLGVGLRQFGEIADHLETLADNFDNLERISDNGLQDANDIRTLVEIGTALVSVDDPGNAIGADLNAGMGFRFGHFGVGVRYWAQAVGFVKNFDLLNLAITDAGGGSLSQDITDSGSPQAASVELLTGLVGFTADAELRLEYQAQQLGLTPQQAQGFVELMNAANAQYDSVSEFANNQTLVTLSGLTMLEIPISYGYAINERLSVGANLRILVGRVHGSTILVFDDDNDDFSTILDDYEQSINFGIDLAALYRLPMVNLGINIRNLNAPSFDAPTGFSEATLDPQITIGAGFFPFRTLGLSLDFDVLPSESVFDTYDSQRVMFGLEWDVFRVLALRCGTYTNLAEDDIGQMVTLGFGLNLWLLRLDFAGAMSLDTVEVDGSNVPREARAGFSIASEW